MSITTAMNLEPVSVDNADEISGQILETTQSKLGFIPNMYAGMANNTALLEGYNATELNELIDEVFDSADHVLSLHSHVSLINESFNKEDKLALVTQMWRVAFADGNVDGYEEYTIRKICDLLFIKHRDYMQAKLRVATEV